VNLDKGLHVFGSDDHGDSWYFIDTPITPADESKIVELKDGSWMVSSRVNGLGTRYVHTSTDKNKSWKSHPHASLIDAGCNASSIRYTSVQNGDDKNRLLF
jgi:sialidase-1